MNSPGIPWFPMTAIDSQGLQLVEAEFGTTGFAVVVKLWQEICQQGGYYIEWTEDVALLFSTKRCHEGYNVVSEIVKAALRRGLFDAELYEKFQILTSESIQERYFDAVERRKNVRVVDEYLLGECRQILKNANISSENVNIFSKNVSNSRQRIEEKRKEEKSNSSAPAAHDYASVIDSFNRVCLDLPKVRDLNDRRKQAIRSAEKKVQDYGGWDKLFESVQQSDFLTGRSGAWRCGFDWILKPSNLVKIIEGNYQNKTVRRNGDLDDIF